jgi:dCTP deaminase
MPNLVELEASGTASVDLRLGRWFRTLQQSRTSLLKMTDNDEVIQENRLTKQYFVPFGDVFVLHPGKFVLGVTLEWLRLPPSLAGYVTGKSSWGRRGLIIETAAGIHPSFSGCLTLELTNLGEVPIALQPGMQICQIFLHEVDSAVDKAVSQFIGRRKPNLGHLRPDNVLQKLVASPTRSS